MVDSESDSAYVALGELVAAVESEVERRDVESSDSHARGLSG